MNLQWFYSTLADLDPRFHAQAVKIALGVSGPEARFAAVLELLGQGGNGGGGRDGVALNVVLDELRPVAAGGGSGVWSGTANQVGGVLRCCLLLFDVEGARRAEKTEDGTWTGAEATHMFCSSQPRPSLFLCLAASTPVFKFSRSHSSGGIFGVSRRCSKLPAFFSESSRLLTCRFLCSAGHSGSRFRVDRRAPGVGRASRD